MARKVWVLDHETKGTGAEMVPLEKVLDDARPGAAPVVVGPKRVRPKEEEPREPRRFRVVDAVSDEVLLDDADTRTTVALLAGVRSNVDVRIHVWEPKSGKWRRLTLGEQQAVWDLRAR